MMISTKGRYALRVMIDLAEHSAGGSYMPMKDVAERQNISLKYLERILPALVKHGLIEGVHGKGGGYRLTRSPEDYSAGEIIRIAEGEIATVSCMECGAVECSQKDQCRTRPMWSELNDLINNYLDRVTIADLMKDKSIVEEHCEGEL